VQFRILMQTNRICIAPKMTKTCGACEARLKSLHQCRRQAVGRLRLKDVFDLEAEHSRDGKGEWQAGIVPAVLDRIHRLSRNRKRLRKIALAPLAAETELLDPVVHR